MPVTTKAFEFVYANEDDQYPTHIVFHGNRFRFRDFHFDYFQEPVPFLREYPWAVNRPEPMQLNLHIEGFHDPEPEPTYTKPAKRRQTDLGLRRPK